MFKGRIHKNFRLFFCLSFLGFLPLVSCSNIDITSEAKTFEFNESQIDILVGQSRDVEVKASKNIDLIDDVIYTFNGSNELTITNTNSGLSILGNKEGSYIVNAKFKNSEEIITSLMVNVNTSKDEYEYKLCLDTSSTKTKYLIGEEFTSEGLIVYSSLYVNGVENEDYRFYLENYTLPFNEGEILTELGEFEIVINSDPYGKVSYIISVLESYEETSYELDTTNVTKKYLKNSTFSTYGLKVYEVNTRFYLDALNNKVIDETKSEITNYSVSLPSGTKLDSNGIYEVEVSINNFKEKFNIVVYEADSSIKDAAINHINTKNIGLVINSNISSKDYVYGFNRHITYKQNYVDIKEYKKVSREDYSTDIVDKEYGIVKDGNNNSFTYSIKDENVDVNELVKQNTSSLWDILDYANIFTYKVFESKDFPVVTLEDNGHYYKEFISRGSLDDSTISSYPIIEGAFKLADIDTSLYEFVSSYELSSKDNLISIKVNIDYFGYFEISTIPQNENVDIELINNVTKTTDITFDDEVDSNVTSILELMKLDNYTFDSGNGIVQYYNPNYLYIHYDPIYALAGLTSIGYLKVDKPVGELEKTGIYSFKVYENGNEMTLDESSLTLVYEDTSLVKYSSLFTQIIPGYLSNSFKSLMEDNLSLATFKVVEGTNNALFSSNADVGQTFMDYFFGEGESDNRTNAINYGYINGAMLSTIDESGNRTLSLMCVSKSLYGYLKTLTNVGNTYIESIDDFIK